MDGHARNRVAIDTSPEPLLDVEGLAARLGVTVRFVRRLVEERRIAYVKVGRLVRFDPIAVERWIDGARVEPSPPRRRGPSGRVH
jgi:excisionase family DNA binding protein